MYKVFFNNKFVLLTEVFETSLYEEEMLYLQYSDFDELIFTIELLERSDHLQSVMISHENLEELWADFRSCFKEIEAAGGLVSNNEDEVLLIHRNQIWDLPKGKLEKGESPEEGALREVEEECGIDDLKLKDHILNTYHTYHQDGFRILKRTYWYNMYSDQKDFTPQQEEGIEEVLWVNKSRLNEYPSYPSIDLVLKA